MDSQGAQDVLDFVLRTVRELAADVDVSEISESTVLKSLGLRSIVLVNAIAEMQEHFGLENRLLESILGGNVPLDAHSVGDLVALIVAATRDRDD